MVLVWKLIFHLVTSSYLHASANPHLPNFCRITLFPLPPSLPIAICSPAFCQPYPSLQLLIPLYPYSNNILSFNLSLYPFDKALLFLYTLTSWFHNSSSYLYLSAYSD